MPTAYDYNDKDFGVIFVPPLSAVDVRVPTAEEMTLNTLLKIVNNKVEKGLYQMPEFGYDPAFEAINIRLSLFSCYREDFFYEFDYDFVLPPLLINETNKKNELVLLSVLVEEGEIHDPVLGTVSFQYDTPTGEVVTTPTRENTRRLREKFLLIVKPLETPIAQIEDIVSIETDGSWYIEISNSIDGLGGVSSSNGEIQTYDINENWLYNIRYRLPLKAKSFTYYLIANIERWNFGQVTNGYKWDTDDFSLRTNIALNLLPHKNIDYLAYHLMSGNPMLSNKYSIVVKNFLSGEAPNGYLHQGEATVSLNGQVIVPNGQRSSFTNQSLSLGYISQKVAVISDNQIILATTNLNSGNPPNSFFNLDASTHKVFSADGVDQSSTGRFVGLGSNNSLIWYAGSRSTVSSGDTLYFVPNITFGGGGGFNEPIIEMVDIYYQGNVLDRANIRYGHLDDLTEYENPEGVEPFFVVVGKERNAIHYIYKKITVQSNSSGVLILPETENGCFAFIEGVNGRVNAPVVRELTPNATYDCLIYYAPKINDIWQFKYLTIKYQGKKDLYWETLRDNDFEIVSPAFLYVHGHGSGNGIFIGDANLQYTPISLHLPSLSNGIPHYRLSGPIYYKDESATDKLSNMRGLFLKASSMGILPRQGLKLKFIPLNLQNQARSLRGKIVDSDNKTLAFRTPEHTLKDTYYQYALFFIIKLQGKEFLMVATHNTATTKDILLDSSQGSSIDIFEI